MKDKYIVKQDDLTDCGISSLLSVIRYYNGNVSKEYLRELSNTTKDGVSAYNLICAAREIGFDSYGLNGGVDNIKLNLLPLIAHVIIDEKYKHFVVIYSINHRNKTIVIMDPSSGFKKLSFDEWNKISTKNYIYSKPIKVIPKLSNENKIREVIKCFILSNKLPFTIIFILSIVYVFLNIITSYEFKILLNDITIDVLSNTKIVLYILMCFIFLKKLINLFRNNLVNYLNCFLDKSLILDCFSHIINLPYLYYKNRTTGDILTRINDLTNVKEFVTQTFMSLFVDLILVLFVLIFLFTISTRLTILSIIMVIGYSLISILNSKNLTRKIKSYYEKTSSTNSYMNETIINIDTIKGMNIENYVIDELHNRNFKQNIANFKLFRSLNKEIFIKDLFYDIFMIVILYVGLISVRDNKLDLATLITFTTLLNYFVEPIKNIVGMNLLYHNAKESIRRVQELYLIPDEDKKLNDKFRIDHFIGNIIFKNVSYTYDTKNNVIDKLNFMIKHGEKVLIYGESGTGKSTVVKLLTKYLDNYKGKIYIDDIELSNMSLFDIRSKLCYISQKEGLFNDTIYNNITLGKEINYKDFLKICNLTLVSEMVEEKKIDYNYLLEENGFNLSGGERQRIILARALLKESDIYIFDESLNAIDIEKEKTILKNVFKLLKKKTIIVISHRFDNNNLFDKKIEILKGNLEYETC